MNMMAVPSVEISRGVRMPILGFGTWQATDEELEKAVDAALEAGYRHFDTAFVYENEAALGRSLRRWLDSKRIKRDDLFIVTKLPPGGNRPSCVLKYFKRSLEYLQLDYLDQYLVHTPFSFLDVDGDAHPKNEEGEILVDLGTDHIAVWREMEKLVDSGLTRTIGLSNFNKNQIERILLNSRIHPASLQIELHVYFQQNDLVSFCREKNIQITAYSPLGSRGLGKLLAAMGADKKSETFSLIDDLEVNKIAEKYKKTPAQVLLRFTTQMGIAAIPKSTNPERIRQNIEIFNFELDLEDCQRLKALNKGSGARVCDFSFLKGIKKHPEFPW